LTKLKVDFQDTGRGIPQGGFDQREGQIHMNMNCAAISEAHLVPWRIQEGKGRDTEQSLVPRTGQIHVNEECPKDTRALCLTRR
jgi:hypothetical protein